MNASWEINDTSSVKRGKHTGGHCKRITNMLKTCLNMNAETHPGMLELCCEQAMK